MPSDEEIAQQLRESARVKVAMGERDVPAIRRIADAMIDAYRANRKVIAFGNGGSAADAQHIVAELVGRLQLTRPALPALALTTNSSVLTAIGNDYGYPYVFARQIEAWAQPGDVAIAISTSGNSANVLEAVAAAKKRGATTVALTGGTGGALAAAVDLAVIVPSVNPQRVQEAHITIGHILCGLVESALFGE